MQRKKILFVYYTMMLGGSTTSLLSLLEKFDYDKYEVDLLLYRNEGPYINYIPPNVNLLSQACIVNNRVKQILKTCANGSLPRAYFHGIKYRKKIKPMIQSMAYAQLSFCRKLDKQYDVAIGFMELWSDVYVNECVNAKKKISWVHVDFEKAHFISDIDRKMFAKSDHIVNVSTECMENFISSFPELEDKCCCIENILTKQFIHQRASNAQSIELDLDKDSLNLLSVCRLAIDHKGLDRGVNVIKRLKEEGNPVKWYIAGDGADKQKLVELIRENGLEEDIILIGMLECPYPIFEKFDLFFLPSRFEGKPMAVTEAFMLGLPPIVANYASAKEQIRHGVDGIIADNSEEGIYEALKKICLDREILKQLKINVDTSDYDNLDQIDKIYNLFE